MEVSVEQRLEGLQDLMLELMEKIEQQDKRHVEMERCTERLSGQVERLSKQVMTNQENLKPVSEFFRHVQGFHFVGKPLIGTIAVLLAIGASLAAIIGTFKGG